MMRRLLQLTGLAGVFAAGMFLAPARMELRFPGKPDRQAAAVETAEMMSSASAADAAKSAPKSSAVSPSAASAVAAGLPSLAPLVKSVGPAVVNLKVQMKVKVQQFSRNGQRPRSQLDEFFGPGFMERFFNQIPSEIPRDSLGSGFIIDSSGLILTNNHVIDNASEIVVLTKDNQSLPAKVIGRDPKIDIALIQAESKDPLPAVELGDSDQMQVGDWVLAIGNPFGLSNTVTLGIISAKGREIGAGPYDDFIQTDTAINPGNSGGPLLGLDGRVIGVNTAINAAAQGIGFAIPINMIKELLPQLRQGKVHRAWLGVYIQPMEKDLAEAIGLKDTKGALVANVMDGSPAATAGIQPKDVIVRFNGTAVEKSSDLPKIVALAPIGKKSRVELIRDGKPKAVEVTLTEMKDETATEPAPGGGPEVQSTEMIGAEVENLTPELRSRLGLSPDAEGVVVIQVQPGGPAYQAGLRQGDVIVDAGNRPVKTIRDLTEALKEAKPSGRILFRVTSRGQPRLLVVKLK